MKEFDLEAAKAGAKVCTRDGREARIICFDKKDTRYPIVALVDDDGTETILQYEKNGRIFFCGGSIQNEDLMMAPEHHEGWVNLFRHNGGIYDVGTLYQSEEDAVAHGKGMEDVYVKSIKIEWED